jgi:CPA1 family monovalent cation:H+ antiporter
VLTGVAFLLIGIAISFELLGNSALYIAWGVIAVLLGRALVIYGLLGGSASIAHLSGLAPGCRCPAARDQLDGLRGAVAMALALSLPETVPDRQLLQGTIFGIVLFTVLVQGTTAERLVRSLGISERKDPVV